MQASTKNTYAQLVNDIPVLGYTMRIQIVKL